MFKNNLGRVPLWLRLETNYELVTLFLSFNQIVHFPHVNFLPSDNFCKQTS